MDFDYREEVSLEVNFQIYLDDAADVSRKGEKWNIELMTKS